MKLFHSIHHSRLVYLLFYIHFYIDPFLYGVLTSKFSMVLINFNLELIFNPILITFLQSLLCAQMWFGFPYFFMMIYFYVFLYLFFCRNVYLEISEFFFTFLESIIFISFSCYIYRDFYFSIFEICLYIVCYRDSASLVLSTFSAFFYPPVGDWLYCLAQRAPWMLM